MGLQDIFIFGIDRAGKTVITNYIVSSEVKENLNPTLGFNISNLILRDLNFKVYDSPGQKAFRSSWDRYYKLCNFLIFVLDTADETRWEEARNEFRKVMELEINSNKPLIFCFNKIDLEKANTNLPKAKEFFKEIDAYSRDVTKFETTIKNPSSIDQIKEKLVELIQIARWEE
jgi:small GTP-binding protein